MSKRTDNGIVVSASQAFSNDLCLLPDVVKVAFKWQLKTLLGSRLLFGAVRFERKTSYVLRRLPFTKQSESFVCSGGPEESIFDTYQ